MATVYTLQEFVPAPCYGSGIEEYQKNVTKYIEDVKAWLVANGYNKPESGKIIRFQVADGYAEYMIAELGDNPKLVHLEHGDAYNFTYAHLLDEKTIKQEIKTQEAWEAMFK